MPRPVPFPETETGQEPALFHVQNFAGINTRASRPAIDDKQFSWLENYIPIGPGNLRTLYAEGAPAFVGAPALHIIYVYFFNLFLVPQIAVFFDNGTALQINPATGTQTAISINLNEFYAGGYLPAAAQWNAQGIIIVTESQNPEGYFAWDGVTLYRAGMRAPDWLTDGAGTFMPSGIHGNAVEVYQQRAFVTTPPEAGGIPTVKSISAPGDGANFNASAGGLSTPQQDSVLRGTFTALKKSNGFLYEFGDSSVTVLGNIQTVTSGGVVVTSYSEQDVDPQEGTLWPDTIQQFGTTIIYANPNGVQLLAGGQVSKISQDLDGIFATADFQTLIPSAAVMTIFGVKVYCLLLRSADQTGAMRNYLCMFNGAQWFIGSQLAILQKVYTQEVNSVLQAWGTDGQSLFPLFKLPSASLPKIFQSKFFAGDSENAGYIKFKKLMRFYFMAKDRSGVGIVFNGTFDSDFANASLNVSSLTAVNNAQGVIQPQNQQFQDIFAVTFGIFAATIGFFQFTNAAGDVIQFTPNAPATGPILWGVAALAINGLDAACYGRLLGVTLGSLSPDFVLMAYSLEYNYDAPFLG